MRVMVRQFFTDAMCLKKVDVFYTIMKRNVIDIIIIVPAAIWIYVFINWPGRDSIAVPDLQIRHQMVGICNPLLPFHSLFTTHDLRSRLFR